MARRRWYFWTGGPPQLRTLPPHQSCAHVLTRQCATNPTTDRVIRRRVLIRFFALYQREIVAGNRSRVKPLQNEKSSPELFSASG